MRATTRCAGQRRRRGDQRRGQLTLSAPPRCRVSGKAARTGRSRRRSRWWRREPGPCGTSGISRHRSGAGATADVLTLANVQLTNAGTYRAVVTNTAGAATSAPARPHGLGRRFWRCAGAVPDTAGGSGCASRARLRSVFSDSGDAEADGTPSAEATGDDASGSSDEDGVRFTEPGSAGRRPRSRSWPPPPEC